MLTRFVLIALMMLIALPASAGGRRYGGYYGGVIVYDNCWNCGYYSGAPIYFAPPQPQVIIIQQAPPVQYVPVPNCYQIQIGYDMSGRPMYSTTCN